MVVFSHLPVDCGCLGLGENKTPSYTIELKNIEQIYRELFSLHHSVCVIEQLPTAPGVT